MTATSRRSDVAVIRGGAIWTGGAAPRMVRGDLVIEGGRVATIEPAYRGRADLEVDAGGCLVIPGLINAHVHPGTSPRSRGLCEDITLPKGAAYYHMTMPVQMYGPEVLSREDVAAITEWDCMAMLCGGATTIVAEQFGTAEAWIDIVRRLGFRSDLGTTFPSSYASIGYHKDGKVVFGDPGDIGAGLQRNLDLHRDWHGAFDDRLRIHLSPHGPDTVPEELLRATRREAESRGTTIHLHLAQHRLERETIGARTGKSSVEYLDAIGFLGRDVLCAHATYLEAGDYALLARAGATCVHAAYRKAKEATTSPFHEHLVRGINVALATDSFAHDLIVEMRFAAMLGKLRSGGGGNVGAERVLRCATWGAARALNRPDLGHLEPGACGDVVVVALTSVFNAPVFDPIKALVYYSTAADIRATLVDGRLVVDRGRVVASDAEPLRRRVSEAAERLWARASEAGALPPDARFVGLDGSRCQA